MKDWIALADGLGIKNRLSSSAQAGWPATVSVKAEAPSGDFNHPLSMPRHPFSLLVIFCCELRAV
jgi:hypothetical protein